METFQNYILICSQMRPSSYFFILILIVSLTNYKKNSVSLEFIISYLLLLLLLLLPLSSLVLLGWSGGAMVLGKVPVSGRPTNLG